MKRHLLILASFLFLATGAYSQILMTKSFSVILDSTKKVKGNFMPSFKFQTQNENLIEFDNKADIAFKYRQSVFTFANNIELSKYGETTLLSGGYVYSEYRKILEKKQAYEGYAQVQWAEARGLELKYVFGANMRYRILAEDKIGLYVGAGPFYEFERWNFKGVSEDLRPVIVDPIAVNFLKIGSYISLKYKPIERVLLDVSLYHQSEFDKIASAPRLAGSFGMIYRITNNIGIGMIYQTIKDNNPIVPIDPLFHKVNTSVTVSF